MLCTNLLVNEIVDVEIKKKDSFFCRMDQVLMCVAPSLQVLYTKLQRLIQK